MTNKDHNLDETAQSFWLDSTEMPAFPQLEEDIKTDVTIVGGGITGITTAYLLAKEGMDITLIDANRIMNGTTGYTTAKITAQHDLIYDELLATIGKEHAQLYYEANRDAIGLIKNIVQELDIACHFREEDAFIYATTEEYKDKITQEAAAYEKLQIPGKLIEEIPLDLEIKNAIKMEKQAQFHPLKYLAALTKEMLDKNVHIYENTTAVKVNSKSQPEVVTRGGHSISSDYVIIASHFPFYEGKGLYSTRMYADRSYVIAAKINTAFPGDMYLSAEKPAFSMRNITMNHEDYVLFIGQGHKTGKEQDTKKHYEALQLFADETFGTSTTSYHWSAQDLVTLDKVPYIGPLTADLSNVLVATGYRKWGMTHSHVAAQLFVDAILKRENKYAQIYTPTRFHPKSDITSFAKISTDITAQLVKGKLDKPREESKYLEKDEGKVITINGKRKGAYRDPVGELHVVDTTCTHVGCEVNWNNAERSWDCPCHGSRFTYTGEVIEGPAEKPLKTYDYKMIENFISDESGY